MGWVTLSLRNYSILGQKLQKEKELMRINQKLMSLQSYCASVTNGVMTTGRPSWLQLPTMACPYDIAKEQTDRFIKSHGLIDPVTGSIYMLKGSDIAPITPQKIFAEFLHAASHRYIDQLRDFMHKIETQLSKQKEQLTIEVKMLEAEYDLNKQAVSNAIKDSAPQYV